MVQARNQRLDSDQSRRPSAGCRMTAGKPARQPSLLADMHSDPKPDYRRGIDHRRRRIVDGRRRVIDGRRCVVDRGRPNEDADRRPAVIPAMMIVMPPVVTVVGTGRRSGRNCRQRCDGSATQQHRSDHRHRICPCSSGRFGRQGDKWRSILASSGQVGDDLVTRPRVREDVTFGRPRVADLRVRHGSRRPAWDWRGGSG